MAKSSYYNSDEQLKFIKEKLDSQYKYQEAAFDAMKKAEEQAIKKTHEATLKNITDEAKKEKFIKQKLIEWEIRVRAQIAAEREKAEEDLYKKSLKLLEAYENNRLAEAEKVGGKIAIQTRLDINNARIARLEALNEEYKERVQNQEKLKQIETDLLKDLAQASDESQKETINNQIKAIQDKYKAESKWIEENKEKAESATAAALGYKKENATAAKASSNADTMKETAKQLQEAAKNQTTNAKEASKLTKEARNLERNAQIQETKDRNKDRAAELKYRLTTFKGIEETIANGFASATQKLSKMFDDLEQPINSFYEYQAKYQARLEGSGNEYEKMMRNVSKQFGMSPFIKQTDMVKNLQTLIDKGINYNIELRAYLATVTENIASTFDAFDSNLLRLIRIQQNDSTTARLGIENALTEFFNNMYSDTSYLGEGGSGVADQVTAALLDASAQLTHQGAAEMEFIAQKWLGSLYSLGVSGEAVQNIAQGLGYLGSGNIETLSGNEALMSLLAMSASKGGTSISDILTGGLTADTTNKLLQGMVTYLAEIANNTDSNNVTKSAIAQVFGITNTDLRSISNLTKSDIDTIYKTDLNYAGALVRTQEQLTEIANRTHISQMITNVIENAKTGSALLIGSNPASYGIYKALSIISGLVGDRGMEIPGIQALGTGTASGIDVLSIAKAGVAGTALLAQLISSLGTIESGGLPSLSSWAGYEQSLTRGTGLKLQPKGIQSGFSQSSIYSSKGSGSTDDLTAASMQSATEGAKENQSEEDRESANKAEKFYEEGLEHLARMREIIEELTASNTAYSSNVSLNTSDANPLHVVFAPSAQDNPKLAMNVNLTSIEPVIQQLLIRIIKSGMLGEDSTLFGTQSYEESNEDILQRLRDKLEGLPVTTTSDQSMTDIIAQSFM